MPKDLTTKFATKKDLQKLATKIEQKKVDVRLGKVEVRLDRVEQKIDVVDKKLDKLQNTLDGFVGVVDNLRTDNTVGAEQFRDHEKRILKLEKTVQQA